MNDKARHGALSRPWVNALGVFYVVVLALVALWPTTVSEPFDTVLGRLEDRFPGSVADLEFIANIILFVPAGLLLALLLGPRRRWRAAAMAVVVSAAIEFAQGILLPGRVASLSDIIANSAGAVVGVVLASAVWGEGQEPRRPVAG